MALTLAGISLNQNPMNRALFLVIAISISIYSCQKEQSSAVDQTRIWTNYRVEFDEAENLTKTISQFRFGNAFGTILQLTAPASVTVNGQTTAYGTLLGVYERAFVGLVSPNQFQYTDLDGNSFSNSVTVPPSVHLPVDVTTIPKGAAYLLYWEGLPLAFNETMSVYIRETNGTDARLAFAASQGDVYITIPSNALQNLNAGPANLRLERSTVTSQLSHPGGGGRLNAAYKSPIYAVEITN